MNHIFFLCLCALCAVSCQSQNRDRESPVKMSPGFTSLFHERHTPSAQANLDQAGVALKKVAAMLQADGVVKDASRLEGEISALLGSEGMSKQAGSVGQRVEREMLAENPNANVDKYLVYETEKRIGDDYDRLMKCLPSGVGKEFDRFVRLYMESVVQSMEDPEDYRQFYRDHQSCIRAEVYLAVVTALMRYVPSVWTEYVHAAGVEEGCPE